MNIDLFLTNHNEAGLVCAGAFPLPVGGVILDAQTHELTLEFTNGDTFHLNIPMEAAHKEKLLFSHRMYVGYLEDGLLSDAFEAPLLYLNDPYGSEFGQNSSLIKAGRAVSPFEQFMKRCNFAQALHRDNLGDEGSARSVLMGADPNALKHTPALQRQIQMGAAPRTEVRSAPAPTLGGSRAAPVVKAEPKGPTQEPDSEE